MADERRRIELGPGAEFDMIRRFMASDAPLPPEVRVGPGDDAAVLQGGWVVSSDVSIEDVHFRRAWLSDEEIGYRAASAALSDLAAMAATPVALLVSMAAPGSNVDVDAVQAGVRDAAASLGASVIGGDLARSPGPLMIDVVVLGCTSGPSFETALRLVTRYGSLDRSERARLRRGSGKAATSPPLNSVMRLLAPVRGSKKPSGWSTASGSTHSSTFPMAWPGTRGTWPRLLG